MNSWIVDPTNVRNHLDYCKRNDKSRKSDRKKRGKVSFTSSPDLLAELKEGNAEAPNVYRDLVTNQSGLT